MTIFKKKRPTAAQRGYDARWIRESKQYLAKHPYCVHHLEMGRMVKSNVVDHKVPHKGDHKLFWDRSNWQALCFSCHNCKTALNDGGGYNREVRADGVMRGTKMTGEPADPNHHWNRA